MEHDDDRGQVTILSTTGLALLAVLLVALATLGRGLVDRAQARTAADAAALAGAAEGEQTAREVAAANHGEVRRYDVVDGAVLVQVVVGRIDAYARARRIPEVAPPTRAFAGGPTTGSGKRAGLSPDLSAALERADRLLGTPVPIASGLRSRAQQQALWDRRSTNRYPVARPGTSHHETGRAVDVPRGFVPRLLAVAGAAGLCQPMPRTDPVHFEVCR
ncbi:MAG TPA: M15 family metallopeptidase [Acidimicrobiales bacterium]|nr:M15 family metallopeptidase [Acidimicrobiales bacterium]